MAVRLSYAEGFDTMVQASEAMRRGRTAVLAVGACVVGCGMGVVQGLYQHDPRWWTPLPFMVPFILIVVFLFCTQRGRCVALRIILRKLARNRPAQVIWEFDDQNVRCDSDDGTSAEYQWSYFKKVEEKTKGLVVWVETGKFYWFPDQAFPDSNVRSMFLSLCSVRGVEVKEREK